MKFNLTYTILLVSFTLWKYLIAIPLVQIEQPQSLDEPFYDTSDISDGSFYDATKDGYNSYIDDSDDVEEQEDIASNHQENLPKPQGAYRRLFHQPW